MLVIMLLYGDRTPVRYPEKVSTCHQASGPVLRQSPERPCLSVVRIHRPTPSVSNAVEIAPGKQPQKRCMSAALRGGAISTVSARMAQPQSVCAFLCNGTSMIGPIGLWSSRHSRGRCSPAGVNLASPAMRMSCSDGPTSKRMLVQQTSTLRFSNTPVTRHCFSCTFTSTPSRQI